MTTYETIALGLMETVPFARHVGVEIVTVGDGTAHASLPPAPALLNHVGTVHAGALFTLGETASGAAVAGAFADRLTAVVPVAAAATITYAEAARGLLRADAATDEPASALRERLGADGRVRFRVTVAVRDENGIEVAGLAVDWHVRNRA